MAAGDMITDDYQFEVDGVLYGAGAGIWGNDEVPWTGFIGSEVRDQDTDLTQADGGVAATDTNPAKALTMPISTAQARLTEAEAFAAARALEVAWSAGQDKELHFQLGGVHEHYEGRTRGCVIDLTYVAQGVVRALVKFKANDPTRYEHEVGS